MTDHSRAASPVHLEAAELTTWSLTGRGRRVNLGFADPDGTQCSIETPIEVLSGLMMTIPRILAAALATCGDNTIRMVHPLGDWHLEHQSSEKKFLLTLQTLDGFDVTFNVAAADLSALADQGRQLVDCAEPARPLH